MFQQAKNVKAILSVKSVFMLIKQHYIDKAFQ